ncbi:reticulon-4-like isoform X2 [Ruditapes philippinarum]|uniref:reticulon-4-like isoform X2 n=1 Tax=Ruditapes philippinarum TaxID=129788 RepID=UPI00295B1379|nr:reticulon-4-like isoform X2 [Ruditapes philippinarum]
MSDNFNSEEFEKVDADQDEIVTSTSMTGEEAEEDRYSGNPAQGEVDLLGDFTGVSPSAPPSNEAFENENLLSFGTDTTPTEPSNDYFQPEKTKTVIPEQVSESKTTAPAEATMDSKSKENCDENTKDDLKIIDTCCPAVEDTSNKSYEDKPGGWMKTVDPRDDISEMEEHSPFNTGGTSQSDKSETSPVESAESSPQQKVNGESVGITQDSVSKDILENSSDSSSIVSSSDNEYSSSADESDSESSDSASENLTGEINKERNGFIGNLDDKNQLIASQRSDERSDIELLSGTQSSFGLVQLDKGIEKEINSEKSKMASSDISEMQAGPEDAIKIGKDMEEETGSNVGSETLNTKEDEYGGAAVGDIGSNKELVDDKVGLSENDMLDIINKLTQDDDSIDKSTDLESDKAARDLEFEKFVRGEEVLSVDNISPVVSDNGECKSIDSSSSKSNSDSGDEVSCTDSDLSGDEGVVGAWSPSPLYTHSFGNFDEDEDDENEDMDVEEQSGDVLAGYEYVGSDNINTRGETVRQESELSNLRADVKGLMEEMEAMVQDTDSDGDKRRSGEFIDKMVADIDKTVIDDDSVNTEPTVLRSEPLASIMASATRERSKTPDHVKFQTPTNTLFYDPDCPIVEKVSMEVADELIDHEERSLEDVEIDQNDDMNVEDVEELEAKVVKDLKEVYNNLEAKGEIEGAMDLLRQSGIKNMDDIALQFANKVLEEARNERFAGQMQNNNIENLDANKNDQQINSDVEVRGDNSRQNTNEMQEQIRTDVENEEISEDVITPEIKEKESVNPFKTNESLDDSSSIQLEEESISEKETKSQLMSEKEDMIGEMDMGYTQEIKEAHSIEEVEKEDEVEEPVIMRQKKVRVVEGKVTASEMFDSMIIHDVDTASERDVQSMIIHNTDETERDNKSMEIQNFVASQLQDAILNLEKEHEEILADEAEEEREEMQEYEHNKVGLDEVEVMHRRLSECTEDIEHFGLINHSNLIKESATVEQDNESENLICENSDQEKKGIDIIEDIRNTEVEKVSSDFVEKVPSEIIDNVCKEDLNKEEDRLSISERATEIMKMVLSEVLDLIYWRDVKKTGVVFGSMMFILLSLTFFTILSVLAYLSLAILTVTLSFRVYKNVMQAVQKTNDGHPFKKLLDLDICLQSEVVESAADKIACNVNNCSKELRRLFLVEDYVDSLKFGLLLWLLTYVGSWFNGMTLIILAVVSIFTLPKVYETYQGPIDQNVNMVRGQLNNIMKQVSSKIPFPKKKAKTQ